MNLPGHADIGRLDPACRRELVERSLGQAGPPARLAGDRRNDGGRRQTAGRTSRRRLEKISLPGVPGIATGWSPRVRREATARAPSASLPCADEGPLREHFLPAGIGPDQGDQRNDLATAERQEIRDIKKAVAVGRAVELRPVEPGLAERPLDIRVGDLLGMFVAGECGHLANSRRRPSRTMRPSSPWKSVKKPKDRVSPHSSPMNRSGICGRAGGLREALPSFRARPARRDAR